MKYLVTGKEMKWLDHNTTETFQVPEILLMEQAAQAFCLAFQKRYAGLSRILVVCGTGNNGADGIAIARLLNQRGIPTDIYIAGDQKRLGKDASQSFLLQKKIYDAYGYGVVDQLLESTEYEGIIDALFGVGISRNISGEKALLVEKMNALGGVKAAVDMASGVNPDNGTIFGIAFRADCTITFSFGKAGQFLYPGASFSGEVLVVDMGITMESWLDRKPKIASLERRDLPMLLPKRQADSNKGSCGKLLLIAGSPGMAGAAILCGKAAYRTGTGLVKIYTPEENRIPIQTALPEAVLSCYTRYSEQHLIEELKWADAIVMGPGIGDSAAARQMVKTVLRNASVPMVVDADALNIIAQEPEILLKPHVDMVVTPHLGEMARLTGDPITWIKEHALETAQTFAQTYSVICVLKEAHTVTSIPYVMDYVNLSGNNGMSTAGSGDVLAGMIGSLLGQKLSPETAAPVGVYLHGLAGDDAFSHTGMYGMMAGDMVESLNSVWKRVEKDETDEQSIRRD